MSATTMDALYASFRMLAACSDEPMHLRLIAGFALAERQVSPALPTANDIFDAIVAADESVNGHPSRLVREGWTSELARLAAEKGLFELRSFGSDEDGRWNVAAHAASFMRGYLHGAGYGEGELALVQEQP